MDVQKYIVVVGQDRRVVGCVNSMRLTTGNIFIDYDHALDLCFYDQNDVWFGTYKRNRAERIMEDLLESMRAGKEFVFPEGDKDV